MILIYALIFILGLIAGSFLNCVIYRLSINQGFLTGRSYCPRCKSVLGWQDLVPLLSFFMLKGRCRHCKKKISMQYPLVELATAVLFCFVFWLSFDSLMYDCSVFSVLNFLFLLYITCSLVVIFVCDLKRYVIPDKVLLPAVLVALLWNLACLFIFNACSRYQLLLRMYSALGAFFFFLFLVLVSKGRWMGMGDVKLAFLMGLFLGFPNILAALFLAFFLGAAAGVALIFTGRKSLKSQIPFGPFLVAGTLLALFFGNEIVSFYLSLLL